MIKLKDLLKESHVWERKFGEKLPTLANVQKKYNETKLNEGKESIFDVAARVMKDKQAYKYKSRKGQTLVDMQTANLLTKVWKKVNPKILIKGWKSCVNDEYKKEIANGDFDFFTRLIELLDAIFLLL